MSSTSKRFLFNSKKTKTVNKLVVIINKEMKRTKPSYLYFWALSLATVLVVVAVVVNVVVSDI